MKSLEQEIKEICENCEFFGDDSCPAKYDFPEACLKVTQVLLDYDLKTNKSETGVRM